MNLNALKPTKGSIKNKKRIGRGHGSGLGKTSGRGHKRVDSRVGDLLIFSKKIFKLSISPI